jgi:nucleoside-diphosphate-sugar epimerase
MILPKSQLKIYLDFLCESYGLKLVSIVQSNAHGEYWREMILDRFVVIRDIVKNGEKVEVFCSDKDFLNKLENDWNLYLIANTNIPEGD